VGEPVHVLQLDHALREQAQRPARLALRRAGASQRQQMRLLLAVQLARVEPRGGLGQQRRREPLLDEPLPHPLDGTDAHLQRRGDLLVDTRRPALGRVGLEQDTGVGQLAGVSLAARDQPAEVVALLRRQRDLVPLRHRHRPAGINPVHRNCAANPPNQGRQSTSGIPHRATRLRDPNREACRAGLQGTVARQVLSSGEVAPILIRLQRRKPKSVHELFQPIPHGCYVSDSHGRISL
jgi:hypothetical protein